MAGTALFQKNICLGNWHIQNFLIIYLMLELANVILKAQLAAGTLRKIKSFRSSSVVERLAVNEDVVGSIPTSGAQKPKTPLTGVFGLPLFGEHYLI